MASPTHLEWVLQGQDGIDSLVLESKTLSKHIGTNEVLIKLHAASLNYRELAIAKV